MRDQWICGVTRADDAVKIYNDIAGAAGLGRALRDTGEAYPRGYVIEGGSIVRLSAYDKHCTINQVAGRTALWPVVPMLSITRNWYQYVASTHDNWYEANIIMSSFTAGTLAVYVKTVNEHMLDPKKYLMQCGVGLEGGDMVAKILLWAKGDDPENRGNTPLVARTVTYRAGEGLDYGEKVWIYWGNGVMTPQILSAREVVNS